ncbi:MAG: 50S ribosomal protein L30 [Candidatus Micrarchaeota archaeon]
MTKPIAILRVRGSMETRSRTEDALIQLHLGRKNHCTVSLPNPYLAGTLIKCKDFLTWGEIDEKMFQSLLEKRGEFSGGIKVTDAEIAKRSKFKSITEFVSVFTQGKASFSDVTGLKPLFRLHPPRKGFEGIKLPYPKGALGNRKEKISDLLVRMV